MNYQWYPGHMAKAKRMMQENIKLIDLIIEIVDARIPLSSRNPDLDELGKNKYRIILLNKSDLADVKYNKMWHQFFSEKGYYVVETDSKKGLGVKSIQKIVDEACKEKIARDRARGILNRPIRAMVAGIPNVGKSTFINSFAGKACTKTGNKPGVTKGKQWIRMNKGLELLDTPGLLWPKFEDQKIGLKLAMIGSINDDILQKEELALEIIAFLKDHYPTNLEARYDLNYDLLPQPSVILEAVAVNRLCYSKGGETDLSKAASIIIDDFRCCRLGRITLEFPTFSQDEPKEHA